MSPAPQTILDLIEHYERNREIYRRPQYNETQARREFIDPLFMALGWDVNNERGTSPLYQEVVHETSVQVREKGGLATKAPDYGFRVGPMTRFFVEAKKPSTDLNRDAAPAFQLRRYAWSAHLELSILTDFDEFSVYDCRIPPKASDKAATARILYLTHREYAERWDEIAGRFSREAVLHGDFDRYAKSTRGIRGTQEVDDAFLKEIETWRDELARNLALRNESLGVPELNYAVQHTIDRLIFLRIAEDRGLEPYGRLQNLLTGGQIYARLCELYAQADARYNSGLFHFRAEPGRAEGPDTLSYTLAIDDKALAGIIKRLYYPESPYVFKAIGTDILGQVYEQFLGKVIRLTAGHQAKVEEKPEVKKAGGVYYTPQYIVRYIVEHTVGKLCEGKTPGEIGKLKIVDPACGSGSFLLGAYQYLLDYHLAWYLEHPTRQARRELYQGQGGGWFLTTDEKKRILLSAIHGVDIDPQAVEVTKLSLLLKVLEGESEETIAQQLTLFHERALPDLAHNIQCGNSLIGPDYYDTAQDSLFGTTEAQRVNAFDWQAAFPEVFANGGMTTVETLEGGGNAQTPRPAHHPPSNVSTSAGGFDVVIGNPPYVNIENIAKEDRDYLVRVYGEDGKLGKRYDIYQLFVMRGMLLLTDGGLLGFILPNTFLMGHSYRLLRKRICEQAAIFECVDLPQGVFRGVTVDNLLLFLKRAKSERVRRENTILINKLAPKSDKQRVTSLDWDDSFHIEQSIVATDKDFRLNLQANPTCAVIFEKMESASVLLGKITESSQGIILYRTADDAIKSEHTSSQAISGWKKLLRGKNIGRYEVKWGGEFVNYGPWLWCARDGKFFKQPKILLQAMRNKSLVRRLVATYDDEMYYNAHNLANIIALEGSRYDLHYVLGLFNSALLNWWYKGHFPNVNINPNDFRQLPIRSINFSSPADVKAHEQMVALVERMLALHKELPQARTPTQRALLERQIAATDAQIDRLVYALYGLTEEEVAIVEGKG